MIAGLLAVVAVIGLVLVLLLAYALAITAVAALWERITGSARRRLR